MALGRAAARALPAPLLPGRARHAALGPPAPGRAVGRHGERGSRRRRRRRAAHARRGLALGAARAARPRWSRPRTILSPTTASSSSPPVGLKLPDATEARHRGRARPGARRRRRGPVAPPVGHGVGRLWTEPDGARTATSDHLVARCSRGVTSPACGSWSTAPTAPPRPSPPRCSRAWAPTCTPSPTSPTAPTSTTAAARPTPKPLAAEVVASGAHVGLALDGDADRLLAVDHTGALATGDELLSLFATDLAEPGQAGRQHRRRHGHDQPRLPPGHGRAGHRRARDPGRRPLRARSAQRRGAHPGRRAVRATSCSATWPPPATGCSPASCCSTSSSGRGSPLAELAHDAHAAAAPGAGQRGRAPTRRTPWPRPRCWPRWPPWSWSWAGAAACCCGPAAPSPSSGSWWRPRTRRPAHAAARRLCAVVERALVASSSPGREPEHEAGARRLRRRARPSGPYPPRPTSAVA